ncbi:unnamed protein product [Leuciscus chuanchicus]
MCIVSVSQGSDEGLCSGGHAVHGSQEKSSAESGRLSGALEKHAFILSLQGKRGEGDGDPEGARCSFLKQCKKKGEEIVKNELYWESSLRFSGIDTLSERLPSAPIIQAQKGSSQIGVGKTA